MKTKFEFSENEKLDTSIDQLSLNSDTGFKLTLFSKNESVGASNFNTSSAMLDIPELQHPVIGKFSGIFAKLDSMSVNGRFYSKDFWIKVLESDRVQADLEAGRMLGIFEHPNVTSNYTKEGLTTARHPQNCSFVVKNLWIDHDDGNIYGEAYILNTPLGRLLATYFLAKDDAGRALVQLFISARGYSEKDYIDRNGIDQMNPDDYVLNSFDVVLKPGIRGTRVKMESEDNSLIEKLEKLESMSHEVRSFYILNESIKDHLRSELGLKNV